jgi:hypothetical protein
MMAHNKMKTLKNLLAKNKIDKYGLLKNAFLL